MSLRGEATSWASQSRWGAGWGEWGGAAELVWLVCLQRLVAWLIAILSLCGVWLVYCSLYSILYSYFFFAILSNFIPIF